MHYILQVLRENQMTIVWTKCSERMPPDEHDFKVIAKSFLCGEENYAEVYIVPSAIMCRYYDEYMLEHHVWTPYTPEAWKELNR